MEDQGIMALPQGQAMQAPTAQPQAAIDPKNFSPQVFDYARMQPDQFGQDMLSSMEAVDPAIVAQFKRALAGMRLPPEIIDALGQMVDAILAEPNKYDEVRAEFIKEGVPEEILPPTFDAAYFAALNIALDELSASQAPVGMARGGIMSLNPVAAGVAKMGRNGDRMLAHITPSEARMLRRRGGSGTINPVTGLPEFFIDKLVKGLAKGVGSVFKAAGKAVSSVVKGVGNVVKSIASSPLGKIALTVAAVYFMGPAGLNVAGSLGIANAAVAMGVNTFAGSTLVNLASGQSLKDSLKGGAISGLTAGIGQGIMGGFDTTVPGTPVAPGPGVEVTPLGEAGATTLQTLAPTEVATPMPLGGTFDATGTVLPTDVSATAGIPTPEMVTAAAPTGGAPIIGADNAIVPPPSGIGAPMETFAQAPSPTMTDAVSASGAPPSPLGGDLNAIDLADQYAGQAPAIDGPVRTASLYEQYVKPGVDYLTDFYKAEPSQVDIQAAFDKEIAARQAMGLDVTSNAAREAAYTKAVAAAQPTFGTMSRIAATGIGGLALAGGFTPKQPGAPGTLPTETGFDLLQQQPDVYGTTPGGAETTYAPIPTGYGGANILYSQPTQEAQPIQQYQFNPVQFQQVQYPSWIYGNKGQTQMFAQGGIAALAPAKYATGGYARGGIGTMTNRFPRRTGPISGPGTGTSDSIPAMLSDGEFVMTAKAVRGAGGGSRREGARRMYQMMRKFERNA